MACDISRYNSFALLSLGHIVSLFYEILVEFGINLVARIAVAAGQIAENLRVFEHVSQPILKRYQPELT